MPKLVATSGPEGGREYLVNPSITRIGRSPDQDIVLRHDSISRQHARIERIGGQYVLIDAGSTNGSFRAGRRVARAVIEDGDEVGIGELRFRFSGAAPSGELEGFGLLRGIGRVAELLGDTGKRDEEVPSAPPEGPFRGALEALKERSRRWESAYRQLGVLYKIANLLQQEAPLENRLEGAVKLAIATLRAERGFLFRYRPGADELEASVAFARSADGTQRVDWVRAIARRILDHEGPMACGPDLAVGEGITRPPSGRTFVASALRSERRTHGSLYLDVGSDQERWGKEEVEFVGTLAAQITSALDHEDYSRQIIASTEVERELSIARSIQSRLHPSELPSHGSIRAFGKSRASREVGGDYFDAFVSRKGVFHWVVADVSGKGVPAALVQAQIRARIRVLARRDIPIEQILGELNAALLDDFAGRMYVTLCLGTAGTDGVRYVNAGHELPILLRTGETTRILEDGDPPCGLFPDTEFRAHPLDFQPGDRLLCATDGIVDLQDTLGERFGPERYHALAGSLGGLGASQVADRLFEELDRWAAGAPQPDDATLLVLERVE